MLVDTDVLIWYMRGNPKAYNLIEKLEPFSISVVTFIELVQRMRNKQELDIFKKALRTWNCKILHINEEISTKAMFYVERHFLSHSLQLADALIATTALTNGLPILTANDKHFKVVKEVKIKTFRP